MADRSHQDPPSVFIEEWVPRLVRELPAPRRALDLAMGSGRHTGALARAGFRTFGVDIDVEAVRGAVMRLAAERLVIRGWCADLTTYPLPSARFELILVTRYLQRSLFPALQDALVPGGVVIYETFTEDQRLLGRRPTSPDHLLERGELRAAFSAFEIIAYTETVERDAVARLIARRRVCP